MPYDTMVEVFTMHGRQVEIHVDGGGYRWYTPDTDAWGAWRRTKEEARREAWIELRPV